MDVDALMDYKELGRHSSSPTPAASQFSGYGITILYFCFGGVVGPVPSQHVCTVEPLSAPVRISPGAYSKGSGMDTYVRFTEAKVCL